MAKTSKKLEMEVKENKSIEVMTTDFLDEVDSYIEQEKQEDFGSEDIITPRMRVLQKLSPQVDETSDKYIEGAKPGMIINSATGELFSGGDGFLMIPCYFTREWIEWKPQSLGGGLIRKWLDDEGFKSEMITLEDKDGRKQDHAYHEEKGKWISHHKGTEIVQTANYYILVYNKSNGRFYPAILGLSSTEFKKSKPLASKITSSYYVNNKGESKKAPYQYYTYIVRTVTESNDSGKWFGFKIDQDKAVKDLPDFRPIWDASIEFRKLILDGKVKVSDIQEEDINANNDGTI